MLRVCRHALERRVPGQWRSVIFLDLDGTLMRGPFESAVFPVAFAELAEKGGLPAAEIRRLVIEENQARLRDPRVPAVVAMDWDDIYTEGQPVRPDAIITTLQELPEVIERLEAGDA